MRRSRAFRPASWNGLESRRLLANGYGQYLEHITSIAQDGSDKVAMASGTGVNADGFRDIHITIDGVPSDKEITSVYVKASYPSSSDEWGRANNFQAYVERPTSTSSTVSIYVQSPNTGVGNFEVTLYYDQNGDSSTSTVTGTAPISTPERVASTTLPLVSLTDLGFGSATEDIASASPDIGADNKVDYRIGINNIALGINNTPPSRNADPAYGNYVTLHTSTGAYTWSSQPNAPQLTKPFGAWDAQLIPGGAYGPINGVLYQYVLMFQPPVDASPASLGTMHLDIHYTSGLIEHTPNFQLSTAVQAPDAATQPSDFALGSYSSLSGTWIGQISSDTAGAKAGSVSIALNNLPTNRSIKSMVLSNSTSTTWEYTASSIPTSTLYYARQASSPTGYIYYQPNRSEVGAKLSLLITFDNDTHAYIAISGGAADVTLYNPASALPTNPVVVTPSDSSSLQTILNSNRYVKLSAGVYNLASKLILNNPVKVIADSGAELRFTLAFNPSTSDAAIEVRSSHVTLDGFKVSLASSVTPFEDKYAPSSLIWVHSPDPNFIIVDVSLTGLILSQSRTTNSADYLVGIRADTSTSGVVRASTFYGQAMLVNGGPWTVDGNDYRGALAGTDVSQAFTMRNDAHDISISNNRVHQEIAGGITRRFLYLRSGIYSTITGNYIYGNMGTPTSSPSNYPESLLTDQVDPYFIGKPASVTSDGYVLKINQLRTDAQISPGFVVSILDPSYSGTRWFRIAQVVDEHTLLMLDPLPGNLNKTISINYGYINDTISYNTWDFTTVGLDSRNIAMSLAGSHFGTVVSNNYILSSAAIDTVVDDRDETGKIVGAANSIHISSATERGRYPASNPTGKRYYPAPDLWAGTPSYDLVVSGNVFKNVRAMQIGGNGNQGASPRSSAMYNFIYLTGSVVDNTWVWDAAFLSSPGITSSGKSVAAYIGDSLAVNSNQYSLISIARNTATLPSGQSTLAVLRYNGELAVPKPSDVILGSSPSAPSSFTATAASNAIRIDLAWTSAGGAIGYILERSSEGSVGWTLIGSLGSGTLNYQDTQVVSGKGYFYRIRTVSTAGISPYSDVGSAIATTTSPPVVAPSTLAAVALNQDGANFVTQSPNAGIGSSSIQDIHVALNGLKGLVITQVDVRADSIGVRSQFNAPFGSNNSNGWWRAELIRQGLSPSADLYFELGTSVSGSTPFVITVTYSDTSNQSTVVYGIVIVNASAAMPTLQVVSLNQDGADLVSTSSASTSDGYQDVHFKLSGLNSSYDVTQISVYSPAAGVDSWYVAPAGTNNPSSPWRAELVRQGRSTSGDLYFQMGGSVSVGQEFIVTVYYSNGSQEALLSGVSVINPFLPMATLKAVALNQDGRDLVGTSSSSQPDGYQDVHIAISGLNTGLDIAEVVVSANGVLSKYTAPFGSNNSNGWWRVEMLRDGRAASADLYFALGTSVAPDVPFTITVRYSDGSTQSHVVTGIVVSNPSLATAKRLTAASLGQDGGDLVGRSVVSGPNSYQDVHVVLSGLKGLEIERIDIVATGVQSQYNAPFGSSNTNGRWRAELLRQGLSMTADLYFELGEAVAGTVQFTITIYYYPSATVDYSAQETALSGISVANPDLPVVLSSNMQVATLNQDGANIVRDSSNGGVGSNTAQDVHLRLMGLKSRYITKVVVQTSNGVYSEYNAPFGSSNMNGSWRAELIRQGLSPTADLYFELGASAVGGTPFTITVFYAGSDNVAEDFVLKGVVVDNPTLPMPGLSAVSLNQDGYDYVSRSSSPGANLKQDIHLRLSGLNTAVGVATVDISAAGMHYQYNAPYGTPNPSGWWRAELIRQGLSSTADLYFELASAVTGDTPFTILVTYEDGTQSSNVLYGVSTTNPDLPTARLINYGQDDHDFVGSSTASSDGYQDVRMRLAGIAAAVGISSITIFADGGHGLWEFNGALGSSPVAVDRQTGQTYADIYFQPLTTDRGLRRFYVNVVLDDGTVYNFILDGLLANPQLSQGGQQASPTASYVGSDSTTQGNWSSAYGAGGYALAASADTLGSAFGVGDATAYTWQAGSSDPRGLTDPQASGRIIAAWFNYVFTVSLDAGATPQKVSLYFLDADGVDRSQLVEVLDAVTGAVLDSKPIANFSGGVYLTWMLSGKVSFRITRIAGANAVLSGIFIGGGQS